MIRAWLDLSAIGIFAVLIVLYFGFSLFLANPLLICLVVRFAWTARAGG